jgi:hypothetical protein
MVEHEDRWIARLTPSVNSSVAILLALPLGLDVWECSDEDLVVAATEAQLSELERRRLAHITRLSTQREFETQAESPARDPGGANERDREGDAY